MQKIVFIAFGLMLSMVVAANVSAEEYGDIGIKWGVATGLQTDPATGEKKSVVASVFITDIAPGGPAERAGVPERGTLISVDGKKITEMPITNNRIHLGIRGPVGTAVTIEIFTQRVKNGVVHLGLKKFTITREKLNTLDKNSAEK